MKTIGKFITFEGCDGSGKTTQSKLLHKKLLSNGIDTVWTREIGGTKTAELIRNIILFKDMSAMTELMLIMAARLDHIEKFIKPNLAQGKWVICDRFIDSTLCYQGNEVGQKLVIKLHQELLENFLPDLTFFIKLPSEIAFKRIGEREQTKDVYSLNKFDKKDLGFYEKIVDCFQQVSRLFPDRIVEINGELNIEEINYNIITKLKHWM